MNEQTFGQINVEKLADITANTIAAVIVQCPYCGVSYYMEDYNTSSCVYYSPIYKDGLNINPDKNTTTIHCTCMCCGKDFSFKR